MTETCLLCGLPVGPDRGAHNARRAHLDALEAELGLRPALAEGPSLAAASRPTFASDLRRRCVPAGECLVWTGQQERGSPVAFHPTIGKVRVRRLLYEDAVGPVPPGLRVSASCPTPLCVAAAHAEAISPAEAIRRARQAPPRPLTAREALYLGRRADAIARSFDGAEPTVGGGLSPRRGQLPTGRRA